MDYKKSGYADMAEWIHENTDRDCTGLTAEQMDTVGMALENGGNSWDRGHESEHFETEIECLKAYIGSAFDNF